MMERSRLPPELQTLVDQFTKFRNEYSTLKTHYVAQEELIKLQKMELEKLTSRDEQLVSAMTDYQRRFNFTLHHLESKNQRLQKVIDDMRSEYENSRRDEFVREAQCNNDYIRRLEEDLEASRGEIASQEERHREQIKSLEERHRNEILVHEEKLERINLLGKRHRDEIDAYKKKLEQVDPVGGRCSAVITQPEKICTNDMLPESLVKNKYSEYSHPALDNNNTQRTGHKRKKSALASSRWPQLDISVKKEKESAQKSVQKKMKKLYSADNETIIDLTS